MYIIYVPYSSSTAGPLCNQLPGCATDYPVMLLDIDGRNLIYYMIIQEGEFTKDFLPCLA